MAAPTFCCEDLYCNSNSWKCEKSAPQDCQQINEQVSFFPFKFDFIDISA